MPRKLSPDEEEPKYYSDGLHPVTEKAFHEIVIPAVESVHGILYKGGFKGGLFAATMNKDYMQQRVVLRLESETIPLALLASLTFARDKLQGGFNVEAMVDSPPGVLLEGSTKSPARAAPTNKTFYISETELTKRTVKKAVSDFIVMVMKEHGN